MTTVIQKGQCIKDYVGNEKDVYGAVVSGKVYGIQDVSETSGNLTFITKNDKTGKLIYERGLVLLLDYAVKKLYHQNMKVEFSFKGGLYCSVEDNSLIDVEELYTFMKKTADEKHVIKREIYDKKKVQEFFMKENQLDTVHLLDYKFSNTASIYTLCDISAYFSGVMLPDTSYLTEFSVSKYDKGLWIGRKLRELKDSIVFKKHEESENFAKRLKVSNISDWNSMILHGKSRKMIYMSELRYEKELFETSKEIIESKKRFIFISGPSSAGKTTTSKRLSYHIQSYGYETLTIAMDDFYKNRVDTPVDEEGNYDFENITALDLPFFYETMNKLKNGEKVHLPTFNFKTGEREEKLEEVEGNENLFIIVEGIHALHPDISSFLKDDQKYKIYINALTHFNLDHLNRVSTSDLRMMRRMVRDAQFRNCPAEETLKLWKRVNKGEDDFIYPWQEEANAVFNTSMIYEFSVLKPRVMKLLENVDCESETYLEANRIRKILEYFVEIDEADVPRHSVLCEFLGNSLFF